MTHEHLGLFDTPPSRLEVVFAVAVVGVLFAGYLAVLPVINVPVVEMTPFVPVVDSVVAVGELIIATKLFAQSAIFRSRALAMLASGFLCVAMLLAVHGLTMPGAFAQDGLLGAGVSTTAWLMLLRRLVLPIAIIGYVVLARTDAAAQSIGELPPVRIMVWIAGSVLVAGGVMVLAFWSETLLPPLFISRSEVNYFNNAAVIALDIAAALIAITVLWTRRRSVLDVWLMAALGGWLIQSLLNLPLHARFTVGWYSLYVVILLSHVAVLVALMGESNRLYARLAVYTADRNREREARMMSMDAVAAAISHEVGQPLAAIKLSISAGLRCLDRPDSNPEMAIRLMHDALDAGDRSFEVLKSVREMFANGAGARSEFDLNGLARETASLLKSKVEERKIALQFALDETLPSITAKRVQIQRVLTNLLTNAIESFDARKGGKRRITIHTATLDGHKVLLAISDTGPGISPEKMEGIFDPFVTTKSAGTGLGLSLSRTIVEEHAGRLWASTDADGGATFHVELLCDPAPEK